MRDAARTIEPDREPLVDTCGTGGDDYDTINVSTTAAIVAAGAGVPIAKHGNYSVSSSSGSADVLEVAGADVEAEPPAVEEAIETDGIGFMLAPVFHPAMKAVIGPRKELGMRTTSTCSARLPTPPAPTRRYSACTTPTSSGRSRGRSRTCPSNTPWSSTARGWTRSGSTTRRSPPRSTATRCGSSRSHPGSGPRSRPDRGGFWRDARGERGRPPRDRRRLRHRSQARPHSGERGRGNLRRRRDRHARGGRRARGRGDRLRRGRDEVRCALW